MNNISIIIICIVIILSVSLFKSQKINKLEGFELKIDSNVIENLNIGEKCKHDSQCKSNLCITDVAGHYSCSK